jgi:hypothetical protein
MVTRVPVLRVRPQLEGGRYPVTGDVIAFSKRNGTDAVLVFVDLISAFGEAVAVDVEPADL